MKRTLSIGSRVPPAVTSTRSPARATGAVSSASHASSSSAGSAQPPDAVLAVGGELALARARSR